MTSKNKKFLEYLKKNESSNMNFIKKIRVNNNSVSIYMNREDYNFIFNRFFNEKYLLNIIRIHFINYTNNNKEFIGFYTFDKLNIKFI